MLLRTDANLSGLVLRLALGIAILPHGAQKLLGWFGGPGYSTTMDQFTTEMGLPWIVAFLVILAESLGALGLILGFLTRFCALGIGAVMAGAVVMVHFEHGFFMNWSSTPGVGEGFEYHILAIGIALALIIRGGGSLSIDRALSRKT